LHFEHGSVLTLVNNTEDDFVVNSFH